MANAKLSELTALTIPAPDDETYIRDVSAATASQSKRITLSTLLSVNVPFTANRTYANTTIHGTTGVATVGDDAQPSLQALADAAGATVGNNLGYDYGPRPVLVVPTGIYALGDDFVVPHGVNFYAPGCTFVDARPEALKTSPLIQLGEEGGTYHISSNTWYRGFFNVVDVVNGDASKWIAATTMTTNSTTSITVASASGIKVGQLVEGVGIPLETRVASIASTTVTLDKAATTTAGPGTAVTFTSDLWAGIRFCDVVNFYAEIGMTQSHYSGVLLRPDQDGVAWGEIFHLEASNHIICCDTFPKDVLANFVSHNTYHMRRTRKYSNGYTAAQAFAGYGFRFKAPLSNSKRFQNWVLPQPNFEHAGSANAGVDRSAILLTATDTATASKQASLNVRMYDARQEYQTSGSYACKIDTNCWLDDDSLLDYAFWDYANISPAILNNGLPTRAELRHPKRSRKITSGHHIGDLARRLTGTTSANTFSVRGLMCGSGTSRVAVQANTMLYRRRYLELNNTSNGIGFGVDTDVCKFWNISRGISDAANGGIVAIVCYDDVGGRGSVLSGGSDWAGDYCKHPISMYTTTAGGLNSRPRLNPSATFNACYKTDSDIADTDTLIPIVVRTEVKSIEIFFCKGNTNAKLCSVGVEPADPNFRGDVTTWLKHAANGIGLHPDMRWTTTPGAGVLSGGEYCQGERIPVVSSTGKAWVPVITTGIIGTAWGALTVVPDDVLSTSTGKTYETVTGGTIDAASEATDVTGSNFTAPGTGTAILRYIAPLAVCDTGTIT